MRRRSPRRGIAQFYNDQENVEGDAGTTATTWVAYSNIVSERCDNILMTIPKFSIRDILSLSTRV